MLPLTRSENLSISFFMGHLFRFWMVFGCSIYFTKEATQNHIKILGCGIARLSCPHCKEIYLTAKTLGAGEFVVGVRTSAASTN